jgi:small ligand-binding sensory domain FIST
MDQQNQPIEIEGSPAISLTVASLPGVELVPFHLTAEDLPDLDSPPEAWINLIGVSPEKTPNFIILADPFSAKVNDLLEGLDFAYPGAVKIGGLASSASLTNQSSLFYYSSDIKQPRIYHQGTIGLALTGKILLETIVAQGCRPIGEPLTITKGERNVIIELSQDNDKSAPPLVILRDLIQSLSPTDRELAQNSLFVGIARDEFKFNLRHGDFLVRNLIGVDPKTGAIAVGDRIRPGQRIQFHLRDAQTSAEDLEMLLLAYENEQTKSDPPVGALMFSCLGRGEGLYGKPNFDSELFVSHINSIPLGGFFCNGEIGPVGGKTFLHGYTSAFAIIREL